MSVQTGLIAIVTLTGGGACRSLGVEIQAGYAPQLLIVVEFLIPIKGVGKIDFQLEQVCTFLRVQN